MLEILEKRKKGEVELMTSELLRDEIAKIPDEYRRLHSVVYLLLADVPIMPTTIRTPPFKPNSFPYGNEKAPLLERLESLLDVADAGHVYQALRNGIDYVITVDRKTMLSRAEAVQRESGARLVSPIEFLRVLDSRPA